MSSRQQIQQAGLIFLLITLVIVQAMLGVGWLAQMPMAGQTVVSVGMLILLVLLLRKMQRHLQIFSSYVGTDIAHSVLSGQREGKFVEATVLFADIRDFTRLSETTELKSLLEQLNDYYDEMQQAIEAHGGVINKFGGDSLLALFGTPTACDDHAERAVHAAEAMILRLNGLNERRLANGRLPINIGIGVSSGEMIAGELGAQKRREFTVLGDCVNMAKRLSDLNKQHTQYTIFLSEKTARTLADFRSWIILPLGKMQLKGRSERISTFALETSAVFPDKKATAASSAAGSPLPPQTTLQYDRQWFHRFQ